MAISHAAQNAAERIFGRFRKKEPEEGPHPQAMTPAEAWALYDAQAREQLGMSAEEFEREWAKGTFRGRQEDSEVRAVLMVRTRVPKP